MRKRPLQLRRAPRRLTAASDQISPHAEGAYSDLWRPERYTGGSLAIWRLSAGNHRPGTARRRFHEWATGAGGPQKGAEGCGGPLYGWRPGVSPPAPPPQD